MTLLKKGAWLVLALAWSLCASAFAQTRDANAPASEQTVPTFRYWKIPNDSLDRAPWGDAKYYPIRAELFNDWLDSLDETRRAENERERLLRGVVPTLFLDARFDGSTLGGSGVYSTTRSSAARSDEQEKGRRALLHVEPFSFATSIRAESDEELLEQLGVYSDGLFYFPNSDEKDRSFSWSQRGTLESSGAVAFDFNFPSSTRVELRLTAPVEYEASADSGVVEYAGQIPNEDGTIDASVAQWRVFLGGKRKTRVLFKPTGRGASSDRRRKSSVRQESLYRLSREGVELNTRFEFERGDSRPKELTLTLDAPLKLTSLEWGNAKETVYETTVAPNGSHTKIVVRTPDDPDAFEPLTLTAFCPMTFDEDFTLPLASVNEGDYRWKETILRLSAARPLVVTEATPLDALQTRESFRPRQDSLEYLIFKTFKPRGSVSLKTRLLKREPQFDSATECLILPNEISAKTTLFFKFEPSSDTRVVLPIAKGWSLDTASSGSDDPISWVCQTESGEVVEPEDSETPRFLTISFKKLPTSNAPTRVVLSSRRIVDLFNGDSTPADDFCPIDLSKTLFGAHVASLRAESPWQIRLNTRSGRALPANRQTLNYVFSETVLREAFSTTANSERLYFGRQTADAFVSLETGRLAYTTTASCRCELRSDSLMSDEVVEKWRLRVEPATGARVDRVLFFTQAEPEKTQDAGSPWKWSTSISTEPERMRAAVALQGEEVEGVPLPAGMTAWEIRLPTSRSIPFELNLEYTTHGTYYIDLPLIFLPESSGTTFEITIESPKNYPFLTMASGMIESTAPISQLGKYEPIKKSYRYAPFIDANATEYPRVAARLFDPYKTSGVDGIDYAEIDSIKPNNVLPPAAWCWLENVDSYYEANGSFRERATYLIENHGRSAFIATFPDGFDKQSLRAVWLDGVRVPWTYDEETRKLQTSLPLDRRFVFVAVEYLVQGTPLTGMRRLKTRPPICDMPVLSNSWNAWTPPQFQTSRDLDARRVDLLNSFQTRPVSLWFSVGASDASMNKVAERFINSLGDREYLKTLVDASRAKNGLESHGDRALTWGDVFGSTEVARALFQETRFEAPKSTENETRSTTATQASANVKSEDENVDETATSRAKIVADAFRAYEQQSRKFNLYVDRLALAGARVNLSTPLADARSTKSEVDAEAVFDETGLVLLFLDEQNALISSLETLSFINYLSTTSLRGTRFLKCKRGSDAKKLLAELEGNMNRRYLLSDAWTHEGDFVNPWASAFVQDGYLPGWNLTSTPLELVGDGILVVNRYFLWALELCSFIAYLTLAVRFRLTRPRFCLGAIGVSFALTRVVHLEWTPIVLGAMWGAIFALAFSWAYPKLNRERIARDEDKRRDEEVATSGAKKLIAQMRAPDATDDDTSTEGFVDFTKMPKEERMRLQGVKEDASDERVRRGSTSLRLLLALAICCALGVASTFAASQNANGGATASTAPNGRQDGASANPNGAQKDVQDEWNEPNRVFVPVDEKGENVGDFYWVDSEFYETIRTMLKERPRARNWRIVDALYEGSVNYNASTQTTSLFNLKATYQVVLDETSATIFLPGAQISSDFGVRFDRQPVSSSYDEQRDELVIEIDVAEPGAHTLELTFIPPIFSDENSTLSIPVAPVPSARLELNVPFDAPLLDAPNARGKISRSSGWFIAELGAVDRLELKKQDAFERAPTTFDVEQYFLLRPRLTQTDLRAVIHIQTTGEKLKSLDLECDPLYQFSGFCRCEGGELASVDPPTAQNGTMHFVFKEPVGGPIVLSANFIARGFAGIGRLPFPRVTTRGARSAKSWLGLSPAQDVEITDHPSSTVMPPTFLKAWGSEVDPVESAYDLSILPRDATFTAYAKAFVPEVDYTTTLAFAPSETEARCDVKIRTSQELFRFSIDVPKPFVVDSIVALDSQNAPLETPDYFLSEDGLTLVFPTPLKGEAQIEVVGRTKTALDAEFDLPAFRPSGSTTGKRYARLYCDPSVYLEWTAPRNRNFLSQTAASKLGAEPQNARFVEAFELKEFYDEDGFTPFFYKDNAVDANDSDASTTYEVEPNSTRAKAIVRVNEPSYHGRETTILFQPSSTSTWRARVYFDFKVKNGIADRFLILADEAFHWSVEDPGSNYEVAETTAPDGARAISIAPKRVQSGSFEFCIVANFKNDHETIRLPKFQLIEASSREDASNIERCVWLPTRQMEKPLLWSTSNLSEYDPEPQKDDLNNGSLALASQGATTNLSDSGVPNGVSTESAMGKNDFMKFLRRPGASATLESEQDILSIANACHLFYINTNYDFFGTSFFTIRQSEQPFAFLIVPSQYVLLEATVNGSRRLVEKLGSGIWRVDIGTTPYVKRLEVSYRGKSLSEPDSDAILRLPNEPTFGVEFIRLWGGASERTIWTCAFEPRPRAGDKWNVVQHNAKNNKEHLESERAPIPFSEASELLFRLSVEKAATLLEAYEYDLTRLTGPQKDDSARMLAWWNRDWNSVETQIAQYLASDKFGDALTERQRASLFSVVAGNVWDETKGGADPTTRWSKARYQEIIEQKRNLDESYKVARVPDPDGAFASSPQNIWTFEVGQSTQLLFGLADTDVKRIYITPEPPSIGFLASHYASAIAILALTATFLRLFKRASLSSKARASERRWIMKFFKSLTLGGLVVSWGVAAFAFDSKTLGLVGAFAIAFGPSVANAIRRWIALSREERERKLAEERKEEEKKDGSTIEPALVDYHALRAKVDDDLSSTRTLETDKLVREHAEQTGQERVDGDYEAIDERSSSDDSLGLREQPFD